MRHFLWIVLALCLGACQSGDSDSTLSAEDNAAAQNLLHDYNTARDAKNWLAAQELGDKLRSKYGESDAAAKLRETYDDTAKMADAIREQERLAALWTYQATPVGDDKQYTAMIESHVEQDEFGNQLSKPDARLVLRVHPDWGHSSYLVLAMQSFDCGSPCTMKISFDGAEPVPFKGSQADSGQGPALFIVDHKAFYAAMVAAHKVKIVLPKSANFTPSLVFDVGGYDASKLGAEF
jgi:hypothetical protein